MSQNIELKRRDLVGAIHVSVSGAFDGPASPAVNAFLGRLLAEGRSRLVLDLGEVDYISSAGLRVLLTVLNQARAAGGDVRLVGVLRSVKEIFSISGFESLFAIFATLEAALAGFGIDGEREQRGATALVTLRGALDPAVSPFLAAFLADARGSGGRHLLLDVALVPYVSPEAVRTLRSIADDVRAGGGTVCLVRPSAAVLEALEVTGALDTFARADSVERALDTLC